MKPIQGIWLCLGANIYGSGFTEQDAYNNFRDKATNLGYIHIQNIDSCQFVYSSNYN